ncbi:MAG: 2-methylfumaryl-CoA isomerase [Mycobacterium sp.]|jgi:crotonobetainyl-CoA:carnitine CoA-transferase CaiB-like acyl-CoA transferase|nr:2-methylfumaryl-CoA isomerase [Mycobacterium sp.]
MAVTLTGRHFRDLTEVTGTTKAVAALAEALGADFADEGEQYRHRDALTGLFTVWFTGHTADEIAAALSGTSVLWERYRSFADVAADDRVIARRLINDEQGTRRPRAKPSAFIPLCVTCSKRPTSKRWPQVSSRRSP